MTSSTTKRRTVSGAELAEVLARGVLKLHRCCACDAVQYPPSDICRCCLSDDIALSEHDGCGVVTAVAAVAHSYREDFSNEKLWPIASIRLANEVTVFAHSSRSLAIGDMVTLHPMRDRLGDGVLAAVRNDEDIKEILHRFSQETKGYE